MEINTLELYKQYKQIKLTCLINGLPVIDILPIPDEYDFKSWEMDLIKQRIGVNEYNKLQKEYVKQKKIELQIKNNRHPKYKNMLDYKESQLRLFINQFPQFKSIIIE